MEKTSRYRKIRCPFCNKIMTESELDYNFNFDGAPTNRYLCPRCKKMVFYTIAPKGDIKQEKTTPHHIK